MITDHGIPTLVDRIQALAPVRLGLGEYRPAIICRNPRSYFCNLIRMRDGEVVLQGRPSDDPETALQLLLNELGESL